jgi:hypothetical protein
MMRLGLLLLPAVALGCLDHTLPEGAEPTGVFIALQRDFAALEQWQTYELGDQPLEGHPTGRRVLHVNKLPAPNESEFPVGTIIAKTVQSGAPTEWLVHAMVKRGGEYNVRGARAWEWFELKLNSERVPILVWRGEVPPNGERYGCLAGTCENAPDCNQCHAAAAENDYVMADELRLSEM